MQEILYFVVAVIITVTIWLYLTVLKNFFSLPAQGSFLPALWEPYVVLEIKPE